MTRTPSRRSARLAALLSAPALIAAGALTAGPAAAGGTQEPTHLSPTLVCVTEADRGTTRAYWGYENPGDATAYVPVGAHNSFHPGPYDVGQVTTFHPGTTHTAFRTTFGQEQHWYLTGEWRSAWPLADKKGIPECRVDLEVTKSASRDAYRPGEVIEWVVTVTNRGNLTIPVDEIEVVDERLVLHPADDHPAALAPGASISFRATEAAAAARCGLIANGASVSIRRDEGSIVIEDDADADNDRAVAETTVACDPPPPPAAPPVAAPPTVAPPVQGVAPATCPRVKLLAGIHNRRSVIAGRRTTVRLRLRNADGRHAARSTVLRYRIPSGAAVVGKPRAAKIRGRWVVMRAGRVAAKRIRTVALRLRFDRTAGGRRAHLLRATAACGASARAVARANVVRVKARVLPAVTG